MDIFVGLASTFMDQDMTESQFVESGTQYFEHVAAAWHNAAPHIYRANKLYKLGGHDHPQNSSAVSTKTTSDPTSRPTTQAKNVSLPQTHITTPPTPRSVNVAPPPSPVPPKAVAKATPTSASTAKPPAVPTNAFQTSAQERPDFGHSPSSTDPNSLQKNLNVAQKENVKPKVTPTPASVQISAPVEKSLDMPSISHPSTSSTTDNSIGGEKMDTPPQKQQRTVMNHVTSAAIVRDFLKLADAEGFDARYTNDMPSWSDLYLDAKRDLETYQAAPENNKMLIRKTGRIIKDWTKQYDAHVARANKTGAKRGASVKSNSTSGDITTAAKTAMDVDIKPTSAPLLPSANALSSLEVDEGQLISGFVQKLNKAASSAKQSIPPLVTSLDKSQPSKSLAPAENAKKRSHDQLLPNPAKTSNTTSPSHNKPASAAKPPPLKKSKFILEEADEDEEGEDVEDDGSDLAGFIDNSFSEEDGEEESFVGDSDEIEFSSDEEDSNEDPMKSDSEEEDEE